MPSKLYVWDAIAKRARTLDWAKTAAQQLKTAFTIVKEGWPEDPPTEPTAWTHNYSCPDCGVYLVVDLKSPYAHKCPACAKEYSKGLYDGAFLASVHAQICLNLEYAAVLAHIEDDPAPYIAYLRKYILFYTQNYTKLWEIHGVNAGQGRIMPQCLTEAIFIIQMEKTLRQVSDLNVFSEAELAMMRTSYFTPALALMRREKERFGARIHNIQAWMTSAVGACGMALKDDAAWEEALNGPTGWIDQLEKGTSEEGLWYEMSPGYHFYTLNALTNMAFMGVDRGLDLFANPRFSAMCRAPFEIVYPNMYMPAYNDSSYSTSLSGTAVTFEQFVARYPGMDKLLAWLYTADKPRQFSSDNPLPTHNETLQISGRTGFNALVYGPDELPAPELPRQVSRYLKGSGLAILEGDDLRVGLKFSPNGGGHDHDDKMTIDVYASGQRFSPDVGTVSYALPITPRWSRTSLAHNMVTVDYTRQQRCVADSSEFDGNSARAVASLAYPGVTLDRRITLRKDGFTDAFVTTSDTEHVYDWAFHGEGALTLSLPTKERANFTEANGYDMLWDVREVISGEAVQAVFTTAYGSMTLDIHGAPDTQFFTAKCHMYDLLHDMSILIVRRKAASARFDTAFTWKKA